MQFACFGLALSLVCHDEAIGRLAQATRACEPQLLESCVTLRRERARERALGGCYEEGIPPKRTG
jgi:hypothetical protein